MHSWLFSTSRSLSPAVHFERINWLHSKWRNVSLRLTTAGIYIMWKPPWCTNAFYINNLEDSWYSVHLSSQKAKPRPWFVLHSTFKYHLESTQQPELLNITTYLSSVCFRINSMKKGSSSFISPLQSGIEKGSNSADEIVSICIQPKAVLSLQAFTITSIWIMFLNIEHGSIHLEADLTRAPRVAIEWWAPHLLSRSHRSLQRIHESWR